MPYKCIECGHVSEDPKVLPCDCTKPAVFKVPTIHYAHELGKGTLFTRTASSEMKVPNESKNQMVSTTLDLNVCCPEEQCCGDVHITPDTVTCPQCLQFISELGVVDESFVHEPEHSTIEDVEDDSN